MFYYVTMTVLSSCLMIYVLLCDHDVQKPFTLIPELCKTRILCCIKVFYKSFKLKRLILFNRKRKLLKDRRFWFCCWYLYAIPIKDVFKIMYNCCHCLFQSGKLPQSLQAKIDSLRSVQSTTNHSWPDACYDLWWNTEITKTWTKIMILFSN